MSFVPRIQKCPIVWLSLFIDLNSIQQPNPPIRHQSRFPFFHLLIFFDLVSLTDN